MYSGILSDTKALVVDLFVSSWNSEESKSILQFIIVTFIFLLLEFIYSYLANSLSLMSDAYHMFCDMTGMFVGLIVNYIKQKVDRNRNQYHNYFVANIDSISGLANALLLQTLALSIFFRSVVRILAHTSFFSIMMVTSVTGNDIEEDDPLAKYNTEMFVVSIGGLLLNLAGLYLFSEDEEDADNKNSNKYALYLHVLADTLGSVGAIIAAILIRFFNLTIADAVCALFTSITIFVSVIPLIQICYKRL